MNLYPNSATLPQISAEFTSWAQVELYVAALLATELTAANVDDWLACWTALANLVNETRERLSVATTVNTADTVAEQRYHTFLDQIQPAWLTTDQQLKVQFVSSGLQPAGMAIPLRQLSEETALFRSANLPLFAEEQKLIQEYNKLIGAQTVTWEGRTLTITQLRPMLQNPERSVRERAWRLMNARQLADRAALNTLWTKLLTLRQQIAANADCADYRSYRWQQLHRFDYTPDDCLAFHAAIEAVVTPALERVHERRRRRLGLAQLHPWDLDVDVAQRSPLRPFADAAELAQKVATIFARMDAQLGVYFALLRDAGLLDLANRQSKRPGAYCTFFPIQRQPFIFMNAVGLPDDVNILLHEAGHAFHCFETAHLPYHQQWDPGGEFAEVAAMAMELLAAPYLAAQDGGFYSAQEVGRARLDHLESILRYWAYLPVVDAFQHWAYTHPEAAIPEECDAQRRALWQRFMRGLECSGLEEEIATGWQRQLHIIQWPFYYVEYGLAQLGAVQIWRNARQNQAEAVARYHQALALGNTAPLSELYATAGARLAFDAATLGEAVALIEQTIDELESN